jgi:hypothetical protein
MSTSAETKSAETRRTIEVTVRPNMELRNTEPGRRNGIYFTHARRCMEDREYVTKWLAQELGLTINPLGGVTVCELVRDDLTYRGYARCRDDDNYCKEIGRAISLSRATTLRWDVLQAEERFRENTEPEPEPEPEPMVVPRPLGNQRLYTVAALFDGRICWNGGIVQVYADSDEEAIKRSWAYQHEGCVASCDGAVILGYNEPDTGYSRIYQQERRP